MYVLQPPPLHSNDTGFLPVEEEVNENIHLRELSVSRWFWNQNLPWNKVLKKIYYCHLINRDAERLVKELSIDVILFYNLALSALSRIQHGFKIYDLGDDHVDLLKHELGFLSNRWTVGIVEQRMRRLLQSCDLVTTVSADLAAKYSARSCQLPNGVNLDDYRPGEGEEIRRRFKPPIVGFVGSLEYFNDFNLLIETATRMKEVTFIIAGGGRQFHRIEQERRVRNLTNLHLTGGVRHEEIFRYIDAMDIGLNLFVKSPLTHAACPIKLFEYLAGRKPVISTRIREVQNIDRGFLYYADTVEELMGRIQEILSRPRDAEERVALGYRIVEQHYTWDKVVEEFLRALKESGYRRPPLMTGVQNSNSSLEMNRA